MQVVVDDRLARHGHEVAALLRRVGHARVGERQRGIGRVLGHSRERAEGAQPDAVLLLEVLDRRDGAEPLPLTWPSIRACTQNFAIL